MQLKRLNITQFRAFEQAEFEFQPGMNLLVGINGAGKSTVLDALRIMLSQILPKFTASKSKSIAFDENDITVMKEALSTELEFSTLKNSFKYLVHKQREEYGTNETPITNAVQYAYHVDRRTRIQRRREKQQVYNSVERTELTPSESIIPKKVKIAAEQPFAVYFSTRRSLASMDAPSKASVAGGQVAAFADALNHRELHLREFADWWSAQEVLAEETEGSKFGRNLNVLSDTVTSFLEDCTNLRSIREPQVTLLVDKRGKTLDLRQLSDGERSMIALVLDLSRRLALANPKLTDPSRDGKAIVLIDELDLHLHPRWQREIVSKLTSTFPNCQFIATTHSPQIVGEVSPDSIIIIEDGKAYRPDQSLGMDTNWILRHLMGVDERDTETKTKITHIETLIEDDAYEEATAAIDALRREIGEFPELVGLQTRIDMINFLSEQFDDEAPTEKIEGEENA